jgi:hypothetical protein
MCYKGSRKLGRGGSEVSKDTGPEVNIDKSKYINDTKPK